MDFNGLLQAGKKKLFDVGQGVSNFVQQAAPQVQKTYSQLAPYTPFQAPQPQQVAQNWSNAGQNIQRAAQRYSQIPQAVSNVGKAIYNTPISTFMPGGQTINNAYQAANIAQPRIGPYVQNRIVNPAIKTLQSGSKAMYPTPGTSPMQRAGDLGNAALSGLQTAWGVTPMSVAYSGYEGVKGAAFAGRTGGNINKGFQTGVEGSNIPSLGQAVTDNPLAQNVLNAGELLAPFAGPAKNALVNGIQRAKMSGFIAGPKAENFKNAKVKFKQPNDVPYDQQNIKFKGGISELQGSAKPQANISAPTPEKIRGFAESVQEAPNIAGNVKANVNSTYTQKTNPELMGEAKALLSDGVTIDLKNIKNVDQKVAATIQEAINQQSTNPELAANLFNNLSEQGTELGRGVQAFSMLKKMSPEAIALSVAGKIKKYNLNSSRKIPELNGEQVKMINDKVAQMQNLVDGSREKNLAIKELQNIVNDFIPSSLVDKALTVWKAGLLTSLRTHERNILGNTVHGVAEMAKDLPATIADQMMSLRTGKRTLTLTARGSLDAFSKKTGQQMKDMFQLGYDPSEDIGKFDYKRINWGNNPVERALKGYTESVFRVLGAADKPFYNAAFKRSLYSQAGAEAINAGQNGNRDFIENLVNNPTEEMLKTALGDANTATFKNKNIATSVSMGIKKAMANTPYGKITSEITMPFTGVPSSILGQIIEYSPIGLLKGIAKTGQVLAQNVPELQRQAAQEVGRGVIGTGIYGLGAYLASKGLITGQPKDAAEQRQWELENKPRNSIMIGGKWRSLNSVGPEAVVFLAGAKLNEEMNNPEGSAANYALNLGKDYLDQSFVQGLQGPVNAITDPARYAKSYVGNQISSMVPNIGKDIAKAFDPSQRETNTVQDYAQLAVPGLRNQMIEKRDALGNVIPQEPSGVWAFVDLFNSKTPVDNPVVKELSRLNGVGENATPGKLGSSQTINGVKTKLTPDQLNVLESSVGPQAQKALGELIQNPEYQNLTDEEKSKAIDSTMTAIRKQVRGTINMNNPTAPTSTKVLEADGKYSYIDPETGSVKKIDLTPPTPGKGIDAYWNRDWNVRKALEVYSAPISDEYKMQAYKKLGVDPTQMEYAYKANKSVDIKSQYVMDKAKNMSHDQLLHEMMTGRVESIAGDQFAANGVLDKLNEAGYLSDAETKALKAVKLDKDGKNIAKLKVKKPKKIAITPFKIKRAKTRTIKFATSKAKARKKLVVSSGPKYKISALKIKR